jgi:murein DD-endopeptidase MepM/ murein hydrolase activator NlpD
MKIIALAASTLAIAHLGHSADFFSESFSGSQIHQKLVSPGGYAFGDASSPSGVLQRTRLGNREYITTIASDYSNVNFTFELTVHINPLGPNDRVNYDAFGLTFMGIGSGIPDTKFFTEPHTSAYLRTWPGSGVYLSSSSESSAYRSEPSIGPLPSNDLIRMRISKSGDTLTFAYDMGYQGGAFVADHSATRSISQHFPFLNETNSRLFFGCDLPARIDNVAILEGIRQPTVQGLSTFTYDGNRGRQAIENLGRTPSGRFAFTFATTDPGSLCIVSWTRHFQEWFPLVTFRPEHQGTEVTDVIDGSSGFYRATYLPSGVDGADSFAYPIGNGLVVEQIAPERNDLYPSAPVASPERGSISPGGGWYNVQDVGSYYAAFGGLHGGEDWNIGSGSADVGERVMAVANGQVIDIRPAGAAGIPSTSGYALVIRHWLLNGDTVDSLYVHIAPDQNAGGFNISGVVGDKSNFTFQVGSPVTKGSVIGVIGAVSSFPPHLHFEMRNKAVNVTGSLWPNATGDGYYGPVPGAAGNRSPSITAEEVQAAFLLMQKDGIIDPSDFIDDNR